MARPRVLAVVGGSVEAVAGGAAVVVDDVGDGPQAVEVDAQGLHEAPHQRLGRRNAALRRDVVVAEVGVHAHAVGLPSEGSSSTSMVP
jgi:hypothetical protein